MTYGWPKLCAGDRWTLSRVGMAECIGYVWGRKFGYKEEYLLDDDGPKRIWNHIGLRCGN